MARIISHTVGIPYIELKDRLELIYPEVGSNANIINSITDLTFCDNKRYFSIEVNYHKTGINKVKGITYVYQLSLRQLSTSKEYSKLKPITLVNINAFDIFGYRDFIYESGLMLKKYNEPYTDLLSIYDINLSYYKNIKYNNIIDEENGLLKDLAIFVTKDEEILDKLCKGDNELIMAKKMLEDITKQFDEMFYCSEEELDRQVKAELFEQYKDDIFKEHKDDIFKEHKNDIYKEHKNDMYKEYKDDLFKEYEDVIKSEFKNEVAKGKSIEIAKKMLSKNKSLDEIALFTGLTVKEIDELK